MVGGAKSCLESSTLIPTRDAWKAQTKSDVHQDPETPQEAELDLPLCVFCAGKGQQLSAVRIRALASADLGGMACEPHHRATEQTTHRLENNSTKEVLALLPKF